MKLNDMFIIIAVIFACACLACLLSYSSIASGNPEDILVAAIALGLIFSQAIYYAIKAGRND